MPTGKNKAKKGSVELQAKWRVASRSIAEFDVSPGSFKPKTGGAKNTGQHTGIYTLESPNGNETMLIKQGDTVGETVAEFVGGNLYQLTIPHYAAKSYLACPAGVTHPKKEDVYVTSVFETNGQAEDAFKVAGYEERPTLARAREGLKKNLGIKEETLIRKVILDDKLNANSSLGFSVANALWHGDHDVHMGNFVKITHADNPNNDRYMKIDHGFSFFNFKKKTANIFNPFEGRTISVNPLRAMKNEGKMIEVYPFNNFWDLAAEKKDFYFSGSFIKGCEDILSQQAFPINENIRTSLKMIQEMYGAESDIALKEFAKRIEMDQRKIKNKSGDKLAEAITHHMTIRLVQRQKALKKIVERCREGMSNLTHEHHMLSRQLDKDIIKMLEDKRKLKRPFEVRSLDSKIAFYKLLAQANDLGYLKVNDRGELSLANEIYFYNSGQRKLIKPIEFDRMLADYKNHLTDGTDIKMIVQGLQSLSSQGKDSRKKMLPAFKSEDSAKPGTWVRADLGRSRQSSSSVPKSKPPLRGGR